MTLEEPRGGRDKLFGARVRRHRKAAGYSQEALARELGVSLFTVSRWERGANKPDIDTLYRLASTLRIRVADLLPEPL
jgi:HTH-type transcriptional regulator/antitoxin HipB